MRLRDGAAGALAAWLLVVGCRSGAGSQPPAPPTTPAPAASPSTAPVAVAPGPAEPSPMPDSLHWFRNAAEYRAATVQTYRLAADQLERAVRQKAGGSWAVILDADETILDNSQYLKERFAIGARFTPATWHEWTQRKSAPSVPGARQFLQRVHALGGRIAIVTNRAASECADTETNLRSDELPYDVILCNADLRNPSKEGRFAQVQNGTAGNGLPPLEVVMWIGDNIFDFPGLSQDARMHPESLAEFGSRFFVLPNPTYGSWERNPRQ